MTAVRTEPYACKNSERLSQLFPACLTTTCRRRADHQFFIRPKLALEGSRVKKRHTEGCTGKTMILGSVGVETKQKP